MRVPPMMALALGIFLASLLAGCTGNPEDDGVMEADEPWRRVDAGLFSGFSFADHQETDPVAVTIENENSWATFWAEHAHDIGRNVEVPDVDFGNESVRAVFMGVRSTTGYRLAVHNITYEPAEAGVPAAYLIEYWTEQPGENCPVFDQQTTPFDIVAVPLVGGQTGITERLVQTNHFAFPCEG